MITVPAKGHPMEIECKGATVTYNNAAEPVCIVADCLLQIGETPTGLWWIVDTHVLPRMRLLHEFVSDAAYMVHDLARSMVRTGRGGAPLSQIMAELTEGNCPVKPDGSTGGNDQIEQRAEVARRDRMIGKLKSAIYTADFALHYFPDLDEAAIEDAVAQMNDAIFYDGTEAMDGD